MGRGLLPGASTPARTADPTSLRSPALLSAALRICSHTALPSCSGGREVCRFLSLLWEEGSRARWRGRAEGALPLPPSDAVLPLLKIHTLRHRVPQARVRKKDAGKAAPRTPPGESEPGKAMGTEQALEQPLLTLRPLSRADKTPLQTAAPILSAARRGEWPSELLLKCGGCRMLHPIITGEPPLEMEKCCQLAKLWGPGVEAPVLSPRLCSGSCVPASPRGPWGATSGFSRSAAMTGQRTLPVGCPLPFSPQAGAGPEPSHPIQRPPCHLHLSQQRSTQPLGWWEPEVLIRVASWRRQCWPPLDNQPEARAWRNKVQGPQTLL